MWSPDFGTGRTGQFFLLQPGMASCDSTGPDYTWTIAMGANKQEINVINARTLHAVDTIHSPVMDHFMQNGCIIGSSRWTNERCFGYKPTKLDFYPENISRLCVLRNNGPRLRKFTQVVVAPQTIKFLATWLQILSSYFPLGQKVTGACLNTF